MTEVKFNADNINNMEAFVSGFVGENGHHTMFNFTGCMPEICGKAVTRNPSENYSEDDAYRIMNAGKKFVQGFGYV